MSTIIAQIESRLTVSLKDLPPRIGPDSAAHELLHKHFPRMSSAIAELNLQIIENRINSQSIRTFSSSHSGAIRSFIEWKIATNFRIDIEPWLQLLGVINLILLSNGSLLDQDTLGPSTNVVDQYPMLELDRANDLSVIAGAIDGDNQTLAQRLQILTENCQVSLDLIEDYLVVQSPVVAKLYRSQGQVGALQERAGYADAIVARVDTLIAMCLSNLDALNNTMIEYQRTGSKLLNYDNIQEIVEALRTNLKEAESFYQNLLELELPVENFRSVLSLLAEIVETFDNFVLTSYLGHQAVDISLYFSKVGSRMDVLYEKLLSDASGQLGKSQVVLGITTVETPDTAPPAENPA